MGVKKKEEVRGGGLMDVAFGWATLTTQMRGMV